MLPLETSKAGLTKTDFDILSYLEYPKTLEQIKRRFQDVNVALKLLDLQDRELIHEMNLKYISKFYTPKIKTIIESSNVPQEVKKNFDFFLFQMDNPFVREGIYDSDSREKTEFIISTMIKSLSKPMTRRDSVKLKIATEDLMKKLG